MTSSIETGFFAKDIALTLEEHGSGRPILLLHGGGVSPAVTQ